MWCRARVVKGAAAFSPEPGERKASRHTQQRPSVSSCAAIGKISITGPGRGRHPLPQLPERASGACVGWAALATHPYAAQTAWAGWGGKRVRSAVALRGKGDILPTRLCCVRSPSSLYCKWRPSKCNQPFLFLQAFEARQNLFCRRPEAAAGGSPSITKSACLCGRTVCT